MKSFLSYLCEANSHGASFEETIAKNVQNWIKLNNLENTFEAERYQTVSEDSGNRDEDYSDVIVRNVQNGSEFFLECKKNIRDNIITTQFDLTEDLNLVPVKKVGRVTSKSPHLKKLADDLMNNDEFKEFQKFMTTETEFGLPVQIWTKEVSVDQSWLQKLILAYNKMVSDGLVASDSKMFDPNVVRKTTKHKLAVALLWRLADQNHTWDICHLRDIPYFGQLIKDHYMYGKAGEVKYIQLGVDCYRFDDDPLKTTCPMFDEGTIGQFDLKFTPRFGTGSMYLTPRSKITSFTPSNFTFNKGN